MRTSTTEAVAGEDLLVLLDGEGRPSGSASREDVHSADTPLHLAFSCYLFDAAGRVLLTRRSLTKRSWPGVWTNSCCGHPRPGEPMAEAVARRVLDELGLRMEGLELVLPDFRYTATDPAGVVENEVCPVWIGTVRQEPRPDPAEVLQTCWVDWDALVALAVTVPDVLSPWCAAQVPLLATRLTQEGAA